MMDTVIREAGSVGVKDVVIGMAHRGRLNVLVNTLGKPAEKLFAEFEGKFDHIESPEHSGDVKYHMGFSADVATPGGAVHLALAFNPSHLEIVNPVVAGSVRARQMRREDAKGEKVLPILIHGDAALPVKASSWNYSRCRRPVVSKLAAHYISLLTTRLASLPVVPMMPAPLCTAPIRQNNWRAGLHVNGDDPEAVSFLRKNLRLKFRRTF